MDVSIVIVTHNTRQLLEDCLQSIFKQNCKLEYEIIVVDNGSSDGTYDYLKQKYSDIFVVRNEVSHGFGHGVNSGARHCRGRNVFILEPDTELITPKAIETMSAYLDEHASVGVVAPKLILKKNGNVQRSAFASFPTLATLAMEWSMLNIFLGKFFPYYPGKYYYSEKELQKDRELAWAMGGIIMIKRNVMEEVGYMDEDFYLLFEDTDFLKRIADRNHKIWYLANVHILHYWGVNQTNIPNSVKLYYQSFKTYFGKHNKAVLKLYPIVILLTTILSLPVILMMTIVNLVRNIDLKNMLLFRFYMIKALFNN